MEIHSRNKYPANALSNFAPHGFWLRGIKAASMEGLIQSFKFENPEVQAQVATLVGIKAKSRGKKKRWWVDQTLYWQGEAIKRDSKDYQDLLDEAYLSLYSQSEGARRALLASGSAVLTHEEGKRKINETILTRSEFTKRLMDIRGMIQRGELPLVRMDAEGKVIDEGSLKHEGKHGKERF